MAHLGPGEREVKSFPREGQLPAQGHTAQRLQVSGVPTFLSSHVGEVATPVPELTAGCLLLPTSQGNTHTHIHTRARTYPPRKHPS